MLPKAPMIHGQAPITKLPIVVFRLDGDRDWFEGWWDVIQPVRTDETQAKAKDVMQNQLGKHYRVLGKVRFTASTFGSFTLRTLEAAIRTTDDSHLHYYPNIKILMYIYTKYNPLKRRGKIVQLRILILDLNFDIHERFGEWVQEGAIDTFMPRGEDY